MAQIGLLDQWTVLNVYFRPRDRDGNLITKPSPSPTPKEAFYNHYRKHFAYQDWEIDGLWRARTKSTA